MLGLSLIAKTPMRLTLHLAFEVVKIDDLLKTPKWLKAHGVTPLSFYGVESMEPSVIGWMPAAAIYFHDPDCHLIEYLTMIKDKEPRHDMGIIRWSEWCYLNGDFR
jgi:lactoylglutathione lyase